MTCQANTSSLKKFSHGYEPTDCSVSEQTVLARWSDYDKLSNHVATATAVQKYRIHQLIPVTMTLVYKKLYDSAH